MKLKEEKNILEWCVFGFSFLLLIGILTYLVYKTINKETDKPDFSIQHIKDPSAKYPFLYRLTLINNGNQTAQDVKIEASLIKGGSVIEKAEIELPFSPKKSKREGWVNFTTDPQLADSISIRLISYKNP